MFLKGTPFEASFIKLRNQFTFIVKFTLRFSKSFKASITSGCRHSLASISHLQIDFFSLSFLGNRKEKESPKVEAATVTASVRKSSQERPRALKTKVVTGGYSGGQPMQTNRLRNEATINVGATTTAAKGTVLLGWARHFFLLFYIAFSRNQSSRFLDNKDRP